MSEPLIVKISHKLGKEGALRRVKPALGKASSSFPMLVVEEEIWTGGEDGFSGAGPWTSGCRSR
jgi:hypothetical protein